MIVASALALTSPSSADGTESLGVPSIAIATGSGIVTDGTGMQTQPSAVSVTVPANAVVKQVLLYWEGAHHQADAPDNTILVDGSSVTGTLIGGPAFFFDDTDISPSQPVMTSAFRADVTSRNFVRAGVNSFNLSGLNFTFRNEGASIAVIYDDGSTVAGISVRDGLDNAFANFPEPRQTTVPQTFPVTPANFARTADLTLMVGSVTNQNRGNAIDITSGGTTTTLENVLNSSDGPDWDDVTVPAAIPAGANSVTVQVRSAGTNPASLVWVAGILKVVGSTTCPGPSSTPSITHGSSYAADASVLGDHPINKVPSVSTVAPGAPSDAAKQVLSASLLNVANLGLLSATSHSALNPPRSTATGTVANVDLLNGLVTATAVHGVSQSFASTTSASYSSTGSNIVGLKVNGAAVAVAPNTSVAVKLGLRTVASLGIYEESGSSIFANGVSSAKHSVNMLRLTVLSPLVGVVGTQVILGHAETDAKGPIDTCSPRPHRVSGEAFTARVNGALGGQVFANVKVGSAVLPVYGGSNFDGTIVNIPGVAFTATATNTTSGTTQPTPSATSRSVTQGANVLGGLVTADVLDVKSTSAANGTTANTTFATTFVNLKVAGITVAANVTPNSVIIVQLGGGSYLSVTLNEQVKANQGGTDTEGTVNAVHARLFLLGGVLAGDVVVASAHSDAHM